jgi:hypothetical protein
MVAALLVTAAVVHLGPGRAHAAFSLHERAGTVLLFRATVPHGAKARIDAHIPGGAGMRLNTAWAPEGLRCRRRGASDVCVVHGSCPFPETTWQFSVWKAGGPEGAVRVEFVVGRPLR